MRRVLCILLLLLGLPLVSPALAADGGICPRPAAGSEVTRPPDLYSKNGVLDAALNYQTTVDDLGRTLFCFVTKGRGLESPTLHVNPGDTINIKLTNMVPAAPGAPAEIVSRAGKVCGNATMTITSVNIHFHGTNTAPRCHSDEVIRTLVNSGQSFQYTLHIPKDEPPGLYWYHPHVHGISSKAVQGGASGAIEVEGIQNIQPAVAGLPERYIVLRDQQLVISRLSPTSANPPPNWDVSVNYVPVNWPRYVPAIIKMQTGSREFWRVVNASANTIMHLQVTYDGVAQPLQIVALDGVPTGYKDGQHHGTIVTKNDILLSPASRVEFILAAPTSQSTYGVLKTLAIDGGPSGDNNPARSLANIVATAAPTHLASIPPATGYDHKMRFDDLANAPVTNKRKLYFSEIVQHRIGPKGVKPPDGLPTRFFITVVGQKETLFDPNNPPAITTTQGAVEEWTIQNRADEVHEFHMHQIHFLVQEVNGVRIPKDQQQLYDTFEVPYYTGVKPYPYIKVKMDFRGPTVGDFVYHCHILDHEDGGMMAIIRVKKAKEA
jgi:FtsP/CotA-like multicopper oxidase with cupredoxin domain